MGSFSFLKEERLLNRREFVNLNQSGKREQTANFTVIYEQNRLGITRLGITVTKRTGNAVKRNRMKRLLREFFRLHKKSLPRGFDMVILAKKGASSLSFQEIEEELSEFILD